jgi:hypothetical protein
MVARMLVGGIVSAASFMLAAIPVYRWSIDEWLTGLAKK